MEKIMLVAKGMSNNQQSEIKMSWPRIVDVNATAVIQELIKALHPNITITVTVEEVEPSRGLTSPVLKR